jgi:HAD superfamily hydrolase (TIGR01509 family)
MSKNTVFVPQQQLWIPSAFEAPKRAIHFDMDGVLVNSEPHHVAAELKTCKEYGFPVNADSWGGFKGQTAPAIFGHLIEAYASSSGLLVTDLVARKTDIFLEFVESGLIPIEGISEFLEWARSAHEIMTLVTSSNRRVMEGVIGKMGIRSLFDCIVTGDDVVNGKPAPEPYLRAIELSGTYPQCSTVIEDSHAGIRSALSAGCSVLAIATSHDVETLKTYNPTFVAKDYPQAHNLLELSHQTK